MFSRAIGNQKGAMCLSSSAYAYSIASRIIGKMSKKGEARTTLSIHTFGSVPKRARHSIKRILELRAHEEPDHIRQQAPKIFPRLVYSPLVARSVVPQNLPAFRVEQPMRGRREAPREPEALAVDVSQNLLCLGPFRACVVHCRWHMEP